MVFKLSCCGYGRSRLWGLFRMRSCRYADRNGHLCVCGSGGWELAVCAGAESGGLQYDYFFSVVYTSTAGSRCRLWEPPGSYYPWACHGACELAWHDERDPRSVGQEYYLRNCEYCERSSWGCGDRLWDRAVHDPCRGRDV